MAYGIRSFITLLKPFEKDIALGVVNLLKDCPEEAAGIRKELLVAIRHFWNTDLRASFVPHVDLLLNDDVLIGSSVACSETLKYLLLTKASRS